jgi:dihydroorotase-like cyclic amidohydrolase
MLTEVANGRLTLSHLVRLVSENPARIFGLYPRKGAVRVGSDADLVVVDMQAETTIRRERMYTKARDSARLYEGRRVQGLPVLVTVRGDIVMRDGEVVGRPGWGQFVRPE